MRFLILLALLGCSSSPTEPVPVARLCAIQADTSQLTERGYEVVLQCR